MSKKVAILRGINVGGKRKILMVELRSLINDLGFNDVTTYIQSGNVIFNSNLSISNNYISDKIQNAILDEFDFDVPVVVRTADEIEQAIRKNPFCASDNVDIDRLCLTFLKEEPTKDNLAKTELYNYEPDKFIIDKKDIFIFCAGQYHKSKLTNNFFENKLKVSATTRNWKTVVKLLELSKQKMT